MALRPRYYLRETLQGFRRNALITFAAISTVFVALFFVGGALLVSKELSLLLDATTHRVEVSVYLSKDVTPAEREAVSNTLFAMPQVATVTYESPRDAYFHFQDEFANQPELVQNVSPDALPASFQVKLKNPEQFRIVADRLRGMAGIDKVSDNREVLSRLFAVIHVLRVGVAAIALVMLIGAAALIVNTIRMAVFARRKEIGIMRLVGATNWHIRVPFLIEGVLQGLLGAGAAILGLYALKVLFIDSFKNLVGFLPLVGTSALISTIPWLLAIGVLVAVVAALFAMRRFLEV